MVCVAGCWCNPLPILLNNSLITLLSTSRQAKPGDNWQKFLLRIKDCDTPETAKTYTNQTIAVDRSQLSETEENEYYWSDLEGLRVINQAEVELGHVDHLINTGANDIFVVKAKKSTSFLT